MAMFGFPHWQLKSTSTESGVVAPYERLPFAQTAVMGVQHAVARPQLSRFQRGFCRRGDCRNGL